MFRKTIKKECDPEIYQRGHIVLCIPYWADDEVDHWVQAVAKRSGQQVDWHIASGRSAVRALGDLDKVRAAMEDLLPALNQALKDYAEKKWGQNPILPKTVRQRMVDGARITQEDIDLYRTPYTPRP